ncbi:SCP2 sterol-binding domain-containing protein [Phaeobacter sp.]|uniref:SCP2 sterol-binding domain-containing protein n=1 Tax=Phaeobacter sp. TaxID=1902409 RepID=UPI0025E53A1E|nr:SCP2 sterol-binding domain-containing protein [Phaeobacter sp.]
MDLHTLAERIDHGLAGRSFEGSLKFDCGASGVIVLADGAASTADQDTDCTIRISPENLSKLLTGKLNPAAGVMTGKLKVSGDMAVALKLGKLIS